VVFSNRWQPGQRFSKTQPIGLSFISLPNIALGSIRLKFGLVSPIQI
jgi:hypothetical protein